MERDAAVVGRLAEKMGDAWRLVWTRHFCQETGLFYDYATSDGPDGAVRSLPTAAEAAAGVPNPCGWGTGMEDSMLNGGSMLETLAARYSVTGEPELRALAARVFSGMLACARCDRDEGFLARSLCADGKGHYPESSRDQYTHWVYCARLFARSPLSDAGQRAEIARVIESFARRCERNVTPENGWNLMTADSRRGMVSGMWGDAAQPHERMRLPMIYLAAYEATGDEAWREKYEEIKLEAAEESLRQDPEMDMSSYAVLQAQYSLRLVYDADGDEAFREKVLRAMRVFAGMAERYAPRHAELIEKELPESYRFRTPWREDGFWYRNGALYEGKPYFYARREQFEGIS